MSNMITINSVHAMRSILMADQVSALTGLVDVKQNIQVVKLGFNFHIWGAGL